MSKKDKLIKKLKSKPKDFTFDEAVSLFSSLGAKKSNKGKTSGSRVRFTYKDEPITIHRPHPRKELLPYQINDILEYLEGNDLI